MITSFSGSCAQLTRSQMADHGQFGLQRSFTLCQNMQNCVFRLSTNLLRNNWKKSEKSLIIQTRPRNVFSGLPTMQKVGFWICKALNLKSCCLSGGYTRTVFMDSNLNGLYLVEHIFTLKMSCQAWERHVCVKKVAPGFSNREFKSSEHHLKSSTTNKLAEMSTRLIKMQQPVRLLIRCLMSLLPDL